MTAQRYEYGGEDTGHFWLGVCVGDRVPMARKPFASAIVTRLDEDSIALEGHVDETPDVPEIVEYACRQLARDLKTIRWETTETELPKAIWIEPMGFGDKPDSDDWTAVLDVTHDAYRYEGIDEATAKGLAVCLHGLDQTIADKLGQSEDHERSRS